MSNWKWLMVVVPLGALMTFSLAQAQDEGGGGRGGRRGGGPGGGNFDPARFREMRLNGIKEDLEASDDEWKVLQPKVEKVMEAQMDAMGGFGFGGRGGRRGGPGGGDRPQPQAGDRPVSKVTQARDDLRTLLDNKSASSDDITKKLAALREAREKARTALQAAQKDLKELCTPRQEAMLVMSGMLE